MHASLSLQRTTREQKLQGSSPSGTGLSITGCCVHYSCILHVATGAYLPGFCSKRTQCLVEYVGLQCSHGLSTASGAHTEHYRHFIITLRWMSVHERCIWSTVVPSAANTQSTTKYSHKVRGHMLWHCLLYTSPSPRDRTRSRMPSSA